MLSSDAPTLAHPHLPQFGKDHINLADWPISVATHQQPLKKDGGKLDYIVHTIQRSNGIAKEVELEAPSSTGLPLPADEDVLIALLAIAKQHDFASDIVRFSPFQLLRLMRWPTNQHYFRRLDGSISRLTKLSMTYRDTWYSRQTKQIEPILRTRLIAESELVLRKGRRRANELPDSYVQWTKTFHQSLQEGNLTDLNLDIFFGWHRPGSKHLHRHLNKVWHAGKKPKVYERDLKELACGHLGMTDNKDLKRNFGRIVAEMESKGYLLLVPEQHRYRKVRPGVWRVRLELHPDQCRSKPAGVGESSGQVSPLEQSEAVLLVREYHRVRFGREAYRPKQHEIKHADSLLREHAFSILQKLVPEVVKRVQESFRGKDCHFGAAVPFLELAIHERTDRTRLIARRVADQQVEALAREASHLELNDKQRLRTSRLRQWRALSATQKAALFNQAIELAGSGFTRSRLSHNRDLANPPTEVLALLAGDRGVVIGGTPTEPQ